MSVICVIGTGYVGLVTGTCLADMGNTVTCIDIVKEKIDRLNQGILPIYEPGLEEMVERNVRAERLHFTTNYQQGLENSEFIFIAVNTPTGNNQGGADMRYVESAARSIAEHLDHYAIIINKSTVPVGSGDVVSRVTRTNLQRPDVNFSVVSNPEIPYVKVPHYRTSSILIASSWALLNRKLPTRSHNSTSRCVHHRDHRPVYGRDDQVRLQRLPGNKNLLSTKSLRFVSAWVLT